MAEHRRRKYGYSRVQRALNFADAKSACTEIQRGSLRTLVSGHG